MERKLRDTLNNILSDGENFDDYYCCSDKKGDREQMPLEELLYMLILGLNFQKEQ